VPKISVIVPVYKTEKYIAECLDSVMAQTMTDIEIVVINDGSTDRAAEIAREYAAKDARIKVIDQPNGGLSAARNTGLKNVTAPLVTFVDSDDTVEPDFCEKLYEALTDNHDVAVCGVSLHPEPGATFNPNNYWWLKLPPADPKWTNSMVCNKIFRLDLIRKHGIEFPVGLKNEDEYFWKTLQPWCRAIAFVTEELYRYRIRAGSIMQELMNAKNVGVRGDVLRVVAAIGEYYDRQGFMQQDEWARHFWELFDDYIGLAQQHRPKQFRPKRKRGLLSKIGRLLRRGRN
jgi:glycosyltransferase involved in cell wall biosynthesis